MPSRARRERQRQRSIQRKKRLQHSQGAHREEHSDHDSMASSSAIPTGSSHPRQSWQHHNHHPSYSNSHSHSHSHSYSFSSTPGVPPLIPGSHQSNFSSSNPALFAHPEPLEWTPAYDSFLVLDVEATCMDIPRGTSFQHGPPAPSPLQSTVPLSSSSSSSASSQHPQQQHQQRLSMGHSPGPGSYPYTHGLGPSSFTSNGNNTAMGTPTSMNNSLSSPNLFPVPNSPLLSPMTSASPLPSPSPSQSFGRNALVDYPNEIIEFPVILMQWRDVPADEGGRPGQRALHVVDEFHSWVRPAWRPRLSRFCKDLTGVKQSVIDSAPTWPEVMQNFLAFLRKHQLLADNQPPRTRSSSIASSATSSPMPFGAFSPASPPAFPMLSSPSPSSHHLSPMMNPAHLHHHHHNSFHFPHGSGNGGSLPPSQQQQQQQQSPAMLPAPTVEYESLLMTTPLRHGVAWCTHGPYDLRDFAVKSCFLSGLRTPPSPPYWLRGPLIDIRKAAAEILLEERMLRLRANEAREFAGKECRKAQLARAMMGEPPLLSSPAAGGGAVSRSSKGAAGAKGKAKEVGSRSSPAPPSASKSTANNAKASASAPAPVQAEDDQEWKRELELDHLLQAYERSVRAWPWYSAAVSGQSGRFSANSAGHAVAHAERVKILPDGTIDGILYSLGLGYFKGRKHSGLDDSRNLARIVGDMARRVGEVSAGRGTPGWEEGRTDLVRKQKKAARGRGVEGGGGAKVVRARSRLQQQQAAAATQAQRDDHALDEAVANLSLESSSSAEDDDDDDEDDDDGSSLSVGDFDHDEHIEVEGLKDGWIGAASDTDAETAESSSSSGAVGRATPRKGKGAGRGASSSSSSAAFVSSYNDRERSRLCALQGQVFERACLLPNSFWKPLYLPTTVFSPIAATAARLLIWGTGPENRGTGGGAHGGGGGGGGGGAGGRNGHRGGGGGMDSHGPPVPARPIWQEGRRHAWMGPHPGQVFWNGPAIVDDADDGSDGDELPTRGVNGVLKEGDEEDDDDDDDDDEVFLYPGVSPEALDGTVSDLRAERRKAEEKQQRAAGSSALLSKLLSTPKPSDDMTDGDSEVFTYTSSTRSSAVDAAAAGLLDVDADAGALLLDEDERDGHHSRSNRSRSRSPSPPLSFSRSSSVSRRSTSGSSTRSQRGREDEAEQARRSSSRRMRSFDDEMHGDRRRRQQERSASRSPVTVQAALAQAMAIPIPIAGGGAGVGAGDGPGSSANASHASVRGGWQHESSLQEQQQQRRKGAAGVQTPTMGTAPGSVRASGALGAGAGGRTPNGPRTPVLG